MLLSQHLVSLAVEGTLCVNDVSVVVLPETMDLIDPGLAERPQRPMSPTTH